jgi:GNAT superfamily N-acetyltransferase
MSPCPHLPAIERAYSAADITALGHDRGPAFHDTCLCYAQSLWLAGFPAKSILLLNRALGVPDPGLEPPYRAIDWILRNRVADQFIGNPRLHWQHYATRMNDTHKELRTWRAWACWLLAFQILPETEFPADHEQIREEGIIKPTRREIAAHLPDRDRVIWESLLPERPPPVITRIRRIHQSELPIIKSLAHQIWPRCYPGIIPDRQISYMLSIWYDIGAMAREMQARDVWFALIEAENHGPVGYLSIERVHREPVIFINKLYVLTDMHGCGIGATALDWIAARAIEQGCTHLRLRVNKRNALAIRAYLRGGFTFKEDVVTDIGSGFVMDDYVMEKLV